MDLERALELLPPNKIYSIHIISLYPEILLYHVLLVFVKYNNVYFAKNFVPSIEYDLIIRFWLTYSKK